MLIRYFELRNKIEIRIEEMELWGEYVFFGIKISIRLPTVSVNPFGNFVQ